QSHSIEEHYNGEQFNVTTEREFKFHSSDRLMSDACQRLHRLCSDFHRAQTWNGRHMQLYTYLCMSSFSVRSLRGMRGSPGQRDGDGEERLFCSCETPMER